MLNHFTASIIGLTITMIILLAFITNYNERTIEETGPIKKDVMQETIYHQHYEEISAPKDTVVIYPIFTQSAYDWDGFHDFYLGRCDTCLTIPIHDFYDNKFSSSGNAYKVLEFLGYDVIDDVYLDKHPQNLELYNKVIVLHNEFVTANEFAAITSHPNVIYLYPNALSSKVVADYAENTITLLQGPGYPEEDRTSGFDWEHDNSNYMSDWDCNNWQFYKIDNGYMLNCYPEKFILNNAIEFLKQIKNL